MRQLAIKFSVFGIACAGLLLAAAPAHAQGFSPGSSMSGPGSNSGSFLGTSTSSLTGSNMGTNSGSFLGTNSGSFLGTNTGSFTGTPGTTGAQIGTPGRTGTGTTTPGATSCLGANYANPLAMGLGTGTVAKFGSTMYTLTTTNQSRTGTAAIKSTSANQQFGVGVNVVRLPSYAATLAIKNMPPPPTAPQVQADVQRMLTRSPQLDPNDRIRVVTDGSVVVLQGQVPDEDERRLVENMVRLTQGVYQVRNELRPQVASR